MLVADTVLGNVEDDSAAAARLAARPDADIEQVTLDERDRRRARFRTTTDAGTDLGVVVPSDRALRPGDVLVDDDERMVVVAFEDRPALVVAFDDAAASPAAFAQAAALGHRLGNHHRDLTVRDGEVLVALDADESAVRATVADAAPEGATVRREAVDPTLFDGAEPHAHETGVDRSHDHSRERDATEGSR